MLYISIGLVCITNSDYLMSRWCRWGSREQLCESMRYTLSNGFNCWGRMWLKSCEIAPGKTMKFIANGASGDMEVELIFTIGFTSIFNLPTNSTMSKCFTAYLLRAWSCSSGGNIPTLFRKAWRRSAESWARKFEPARRRDSPVLRSKPQKAKLGIPFLTSCNDCIVTHRLRAVSHFSSVCSLVDVTRVPFPYFPTH